MTELLAALFEFHRAHPGAVFGLIQLVAALAQLWAVIVLWRCR